MSLLSLFRRSQPLTAALLLALATGRAGGADKVADGSPAIEARMAAVMASPELLGAAAEAGRRASQFCVNCHGESGLSQHGHVPNLAGQHPVFLLTQIEKFADGRRQDEFMTGLIKVLKPEDRFNMAIYFASQSVPVKPARDAASARRGQQLYARACVGCHGAQARGQKRIARLAGQQPEYLVRALDNYRTGKGRKDPVMTAVAKGLSNGDIQALAAYLPTIP